MKDLVLGGDGLIGTALIKALRARGGHADSLDLKSGCDLRYVADNQFVGYDRVWFLAWDTGGAKYIEAADRQHEMYKHNAELSARVFDLLARSRLPFLFITSQLAGQPNAYGMTKLLAECWSKQLGGRVARLWNTYGWEHPDTRSHVITDLVLSGLRDGCVRCMTTGEERRRFIYQDDCAQALIRLFESDKQTADIGGNQWFSIRQVAEEVGRQLGVAVQAGTAKGSEVMIDPDNTLSDLSPGISLEEGISRVINEARKFMEGLSETAVTADSTTR